MIFFSIEVIFRENYDEVLISRQMKLWPRRWLRWCSIPMNYSSFVCSFFYSGIGLLVWFPWAYKVSKYDTFVQLICSFTRKSLILSTLPLFISSDPGIISDDEIQEPIGRIEKGFKIQMPIENQWKEERFCRWKNDNTISVTFKRDWSITFWSQDIIGLRSWTWTIIRSSRRRRFFFFSFSTSPFLSS
jgi:hypothetical protein